MGLMVGALSSCNGLTGIYDLSPGEGLGGSGDDALAAGGKPRAAGGSVGSGGRKTASGGSVESSGGERSSGGAREGSGGTREGAGGAREGGGGAGVGGSSGGQEATGGAAAGGSSGGSENVGGSGGEPAGGLPLLDDFSTALDTMRWKNLFNFRTNAGALECDDCGKALLWNETFALPQAASVRLGAVAVGADEMNVVLLASGYECDLIEIVYAPLYSDLGILSCQGGEWKYHEWYRWAVTGGDVIEGRVRAATESGSVTVEAFVNGAKVVEATFPFVRTSGAVGISGVCASGVCEGPLLFDDFRGGELAE